MVEGSDGAGGTGPWTTRTQRPQFGDGFAGIEPEIGTYSASRRGSPIEQPIRNMAQVAPEVSSTQERENLQRLRQNLRDGNMDQFCTNIRNLYPGMEASQIQSVFRSLQADLNRAGIRTSIESNGDRPILRMHRTLNAEGNPISGRTGILQTVSFRAGDRNPTTSIGYIVNGQARSPVPANFAERISFLRSTPNNPLDNIGNTMRRRG